MGCAIEVLNVRGHGLHENVYENCLCVEFRLRGIPFTQQERHQVLYKGELVGEYVPDLVVQQKLIVDTRTYFINMERVRCQRFVEATRREE